MSCRPLSVSTLAVTAVVLPIVVATGGSVCFLVRADSVVAKLVGSVAASILLPLGSMFTLVGALAWPSHTEVSVNEYCEGWKSCALSTGRGFLQAIGCLPSQEIA